MPFSFYKLPDFLDYTIFINYIKLKKLRIIELSDSKTRITTNFMLIICILADIGLVYYYNEIEQLRNTILIIAFINIFTGLRIAFFAEVFITGKKLMIKKKFRVELDFSVHNVETYSQTIGSTHFTIIKCSYNAKTHWTFISSKIYSAEELIKLAKKQESY